MPERRRDRRYIVEGLELTVDGRRAEILDLSPRSVRLRFDAVDAARRVARLAFTSTHPGWAGVYTTEGRLVRADPVNCIYAVTPPHDAWADLVCDHNAFALDRSQQLRPLQRSA